MEVSDGQRFRGQVRTLVFEGDISADRFMTVLDDRTQPEWNRFVEERVVNNLVTNVGRGQMTALIVGSTTTRAGYLALSTAAIAPAITDTVLPSEFIRSALTTIQVYNTTYQRYATYFPSVSFTSTSINSVGLFDAASTGGNMYADASATISKTATQSLTVDWKILAST